MNELFAIEPTALNNYGDLNRVLTKFGFYNGRFITTLPKDWAKMAYDHVEKNMLDGNNKLAAKRMIDKANEQGAFVQSEKDYYLKSSWINNVKSLKLFGILVTKIEDAKPEDNCYSSSAVLNDPALEEQFYGTSGEATWFIPSIESFASMAKVLISVSREIYLIDPFIFYKIKCIDVLNKFVEIGNKFKCNRFVIFTDDNKLKHVDDIEGRIKNKFINSKVSITLNYVDKDSPFSDDADFHPRFILSKVGAIEFNKGFEIDKTKRICQTARKNIHEGLCKRYIDGQHGLKITSSRTIESTNF